MPQLTDSHTKNDLAARDQVDILAICTGVCVCGCGWQGYFKCPYDEKCKMDLSNRRFCKRCRLKKCFEIGMRKEYILTEEEKALKRQKIEENRYLKKICTVPKKTPSPRSEYVHYIGSVVLIVIVSTSHCGLSGQCNKPPPPSLCSLLAWRAQQPRAAAAHGRSAAGSVRPVPDNYAL